LSPSTLTGYTIESEMMCTDAPAKMPDMGVLANRYSLVLDGNKQELRIISWESSPHARVDQTIPWPWKPGEWYTLKLTVDARGEKGHIRAKAWPRGTSEPKEWTIEVEDPVPNHEGSPALYGYSIGIIENKTGSDLYYDNVSVTANKE